MPEGALRADLDRLLAKSFISPYFRYAGWEISGFNSDRPAKDVILEYAFKAYTTDKLPGDIKAFLELCAQSSDIWGELFEGKVSKLSKEEQDKKVIDEMIKRGIIEE